MPTAKIKMDLNPFEADLIASIRRLPPLERARRAQAIADHVAALADGMAAADRMTAEQALSA